MFLVMFLTSSFWAECFYAAVKCRLRLKRVNPRFEFSCIFILLSRESDQCAVTSLLRPSLDRLPHQDGGIPLSVFPYGTTSNLADLYSQF